MSVYIGKESYVYGKTETTWNNVEVMGNGSSQKHIPFNRMTGFIPPEPRYRERVVYLFHSDVPQIIFTELLMPGEGVIETFFKDPFWLLKIFTRKTINSNSAWTGSEDVIDADFTTVADRESSAIQYHIQDRDASNDIDVTLKGGKITQYQWIIRKGDIVLERIRIKMGSLAEATQHPDIDNGYDGGEFDRTGVDGGFGNWDTEITRPIHAKDIILKWGSSVLAGLSIENFTLIVDIGEEMMHIQSSLTPQVEFSGVKGFRLEVDGKLKTNTHVSEVRKLFSAKTKQTLKISYNTGEDKYIQFTQAYFSDDWDIIEIPGSGEVADCRFVIKGGEATALSFKWTGTVVKDPSDIINHDN